MRRAFLLVTLAATSTCGGGGGGNNAPDAEPAPYCTPQSGTSLRLQLITDALERPVAITAPAGDPRIFIVEQPGRIRIVADGVLREEPFLTIETNDLGDEQGLLGLAFHPDYDDNGRFFVFYVLPGGNNLRVAEYGADPGSNTARTDERMILDIEHPYDNHNGGTVAFGPDGLLYISVGDGGGQNDFVDSGQTPTTLRSKILRIDVDSGDPYGIPPGNPWADGEGGVAEMYAWGFRNPYRFTIDPQNGDLWIGDVGQGTYEELDLVRAGDAGKNFGWPVFEGPDCFTDDEGGNAGCDQPADYDPPAVAYNRVGTGQCSVIAGPVYRGTCMPDLAGRIFFGDYCAGEVRSFPATSDTIAFDDTTDHTADLDPAPRVLEGRLSSFGVDGYNELYVASLQGGAVYRIEVE